MDRRSPNTFRTLAVFLFCILTSRTAHARRIYFELGGGVSQIRGGSSFFDSTTTQVLGTGAAFNFALAAKLTPLDSPVQFHLGVEHRFASGTDGANAYSLQAS